VGSRCEAAFSPRGLSSFTVRRRSGSRGLVLVGLALAASAVGLGAWAITSGSSSTSDAGGRSGTTAAVARPRGHPRSRKASSLHLVERRTGSLPSALQDAAPVALGGGRAMLLGGLTRRTPRRTILVARARGAGRQAASWCVARRRRRPARSSRVPFRRWQRAEPAGLDRSGGSRLGRDGRRRPAAGAQLRPGGRRRRADRVRRWRLHGPTVARHDRRVAGGLASSHRCAPALAGALRRGDCRGRPGRDRRRLSPERDGQRGGAGVLAGHGQSREDWPVACADDARLGRRSGDVAYGSEAGRSQHADGLGGRRRPPARNWKCVARARV
jgi:hypothetical protein